MSGATSAERLCGPPAGLARSGSRVFEPRGRIAFLLAILLSILTFAAYLPVFHNGFINYDDPEYVTQNPQVSAGLTGHGLIWAFSTGHASNWHPLTWVSHMLDYEVYGLNPAGHHLTNLLLHIANSALLLLFLNRVTGALWRSGFVATLFALHPLHVESVAWISERKDVLSTFFFLLTLLAYTRYVKARVPSPGPLAGGPQSTVQSPDPAIHGLQSLGGGSGPAARPFYALSLALFALGLMSKPMVVTLPFVLVLLDYWPLQRFELSNFSISFLRRLVFEKVPFFGLAAVASLVTLLVQEAGGAVSSLSRIPLSTRAANVAMAYVQYLSKTIWPDDLAILYPYQRHPAILFVLGAAVILALISTLCLISGKSRGYLVVGWFWFLGTLVPVIGLVQVGAQSMADRYMYIPSIGLFVILSWGAAELGAQLRNTRPVLACVGLAAGVAFMAWTNVQLTYWRDSIKLFRHAVDVTGGNYIAWNNLGNAFNEAGQPTNALACYTESVRIKPDYEEGQYNLGTACLVLGRLPEAISHLSSAIQIDPTSARAFNNLGRASLADGRLDDGLRGFSRATQLSPNWAEAHYNLGTCLLSASRPLEGLAELAKSIALDPANPQAQVNFGVALVQQGRGEEALPHFAKAAELAPNDPEVHFDYGLALLEQNQPAEAALQFVEQLRLHPDDARAHYRLALALTQLQRRNEAIAQFRETLRLAPGFREARNELAFLSGEQSKRSTSTP